MGKYINIAITVILLSFYFFPFEFTFLPTGLNTKLGMAIVSLFLICANLVKRRNGNIDKDFFIVCVYAAMVSLSTLVAVFYNGTTDYVYVSYIISMLVWLGGAYTSLAWMKWVHGRVTVPIVVNYLVLVCVMQCLLAIAISRYPMVSDFCNSFCQGLEWMSNEVDGRLYGIGCAFDVAGMRFAAVLIMMGIVLPFVAQIYSKIEVALYLFSFSIIAVVGSMIARTTSVGAVVALMYLVFTISINSYSPSRTTIRLRKWILGWIVIMIATILILYNVDQQFQKDFRFAFEGFFSLAESGRWKVHSNDVLVSMYRFPETLKTWIIGDGYIYDTTLDPYYTGVEYKEYYMATDVGYLRFIYYSGLIGLLTFVAFMYKVALTCMSKHPEYKLMFFLLFVLQLLVWFKVASDIFLVFALFLLVDSKRQNSVIQYGEQTVE